MCALAFACMCVIDLRIRALVFARPSGMTVFMFEAALSWDALAIILNVAQLSRYSAAARRQLQCRWRIVNYFICLQLLPKANLGRKRLVCASFWGVECVLQRVRCRTVKLRTYCDWCDAAAKAMCISIFQNRLTFTSILHSLRPVLIEYFYSCLFFSEFHSN